MAKIKPILFSKPMVEALLNGTKTQTRRFLDAHTDNAPATVFNGSVMAYDENDEIYQWGKIHSVGDVLWVREAWQAAHEFNKTKPSEIPENHSNINYCAGNISAWDAKKRPSIFMPKWASRLTLKVINVKVELLNDITEIDAIKEGVKSASEFRELWNNINGQGSWDANPWVVVYEFSVIQQNINEVA